MGHQKVSSTTDVRIKALGKQASQRKEAVKRSVCNAYYASTYRRVTIEDSEGNSNIQLLGHKCRNYISVVPTKFLSQQNVMEMQ